MQRLGKLRQLTPTVGTVLEVEYWLSLSIDGEHEQVEASSLVPALSQVTWVEAKSSLFAQLSSCCLCGRFSALDVTPWSSPEAVVGALAEQDASCGSHQEDACTSQVSRHVAHLTMLGTR